jgi:hypothetical protein
LNGTKKGLHAFFKLCLIMIPVYVIVYFLKFTPVIDYISSLFEPFMVYFGLPGQSALCYVTGSFVNLYAALAIIAGLDLTGRQVTILAVMMGISHSQIMETAILAQMKARPAIVTTARIVFSLVVGYILNLVMPV